MRKGPVKIMAVAPHTNVLVASGEDRVGKVPREYVGNGIGDPSRRSFLKGAAALGSGALIPGALAAQAPVNKARVIDCHFHFGSPAYAKAIEPKIGHQVAGFVAPRITDLEHWQNYSQAKVVEYMDQNE